MRSIATLRFGAVLFVDAGFGKGRADIYRGVFFGSYARYSIKNRRSGYEDIAGIAGNRHCSRMRKLSPASSTLLIGAIGAVLLWFLDEKPAAIALFVAEGIGWAAIYAFSSSNGRDG